MEQLKKLFLNEFEVAATRGIGLRALRSMRMRGSGPPFHKISGAIGRKAAGCCTRRLWLMTGSETSLQAATAWRAAYDNTRRPPSYGHAG